MFKKLTEEQVRKLYAFCLKSEVYEYDLQIEIVDHLASSIEEQWQNNPNLSFGWALKNALKKFGKNGLQKLERKVKKQLQRNFRIILWNYFFEFLKLPKIILTGVFSLSLYTIFQLAPNNTTVLYFITIPAALFSFYYHYYIFPRKIAIHSDGNRTFILLDYLNNVNKKIRFFVQLPYWVLLFSNELSLRNSNIWWKEALISFLLACLVVLFYGYFYYLPDKIRGYFFRNYLENSN